MARVQAIWAIALFAWLSPQRNFLERPRHGARPATQGEWYARRWPSVKGFVFSRCAVMPVLEAAKWSVVEALARLVARVERVLQLGHFGRQVHDRQQPVQEALGRIVAGE